MGRKSNLGGLKKEKKFKIILIQKKKTNEDRDQLLGGNGKNYTEQM